jgi:hypothetical protein
MAMVFLLNKGKIKGFSIRIEDSWMFKLAFYM